MAKTNAKTLRFRPNVNEPLICSCSTKVHSNIKKARTYDAGLVEKEYLGSFMTNTFL